jgi:hypothetical protein
MKIIMLAGNGDKGKTETLRKVYARLSNNVKPIHYQEFIYPQSTDIECYPLYHHDKKVALYTEGDKWDDIKNAILKFNSIGADVLIIPFNLDGIEQEAKDDDNKSDEECKEIRTDMKLFHPKTLENIQPHCVIYKRVTGDKDALPTDNENNEKDCQAIIDRI